MASVVLAKLPRLPSHGEAVIGRMFFVPLPPDLKPGTAHTGSMLTSILQHILPSLQQNLAGIAIAVFAGYLATTALLITLAISRHDSLTPISRAIAGRYHVPTMITEVVSLLLSLAIGTASRLAAIYASCLEAVSLILVIWILYRAIDAAVRPRRYDLLAVNIAKSDVARRVHRAIVAHRSQRSPACLRGMMLIDDVRKSNPTLRIVFARYDGLIVYRRIWLWCLEHVRRTASFERNAWLAQDPGALVKRGDALWMATPRGLQALLCRWAVHLVRFDIDYWRDIMLLTVSAYDKDDHAVYDRSLSMIYTALRALGEVGCRYGEMWPAIGCPEAFEVGHQLEEILRRISRLGWDEEKKRVGRIVLILVGMAIEDERVNEIVQYLLDRVNDMQLIFPPEDLSFALLRQHYFELNDGVLAIWARLSHYWLGRSQDFDIAVQRLVSSGVRQDQIRGKQNLAGAMLQLIGRADAFPELKPDAEELAASMADLLRQAKLID